MDVFDFREQVVAKYRDFTRSFTRIAAPDIRTFVDREYERESFWPAPLIQLNPSFVSGGTVEALVDAGQLDPECSRIFRFGKEDGAVGTSLTLHRHQTEAIAIAQARQSYVLTTGTGSGKSLTYILPIVDAVLRRRRAGDTRRRTTAIIVYPMNALCNSQLEELQKYLGLGFEQPLVTFARYTGQESQEERARLSQDPPDILLTNYVMLELILTRQSEVDTRVIRGCEGLDFLVLDELHTYRGRQGADVAMLVRRVRERLNPELLCVGTSATMASDGSAADRAAVVAEVAGKLFGTPVRPEHVVTETLERVTDGELPIARGRLAEAVRESLTGLPTGTGATELRSYPLAVWVELQLGLEREDGRADGKWVRRSKPSTLDAAATQLAQDSGVVVETCRRSLSAFLLAAYRIPRAAGRPFFAFRLHQFIAAAGDLLGTLEAPEQRWFTLQGQEFKPGDRRRRLFPLCFCRTCGQEFHPIWATLEDREPQRIEPRELGDRSSRSEAGLHFGYFMPDANLRYDADSIETAKYPDGWTEYDAEGNLRLKSYYRKFKPVALAVNALGQSDPGGLNGWYLDGPFRFCPNCGEAHSSRKGEFAKLARLSTEGRSSATTVISLAVLQHLLTGNLDIPDNARKLLGFTDNRQDAALQAGHFNDFVQVLTLRSALLAALDRSADGALKEDELGQAVDSALNLPASAFLSGGATAKPPVVMRARQVLREVLAYRLYADLRRGWRVANPNLEQLKLLAVGYEHLEDCCADESVWQDKHPLLAQLPAAERQGLVQRLLTELRQGLAISTRLLDFNEVDRLRTRSYELLDPWGFEEDERLKTATVCIPRPYRGKGRKDPRFLHLSDRSEFGRWLKARERWLAVEPLYPPTGLKQPDYEQLVDGLFAALTDWGLVEVVPTDRSQTGYRLRGSALVWRRSHATLEGQENQFFRDLYETTATLLEGEGQGLLQQLEAREHTAQVESEMREQREGRFRDADLRLLYCSPTMELGVDIASLNTVYLRNVPPTPANYAQRSGRAGRSGQPALVITYCAARAPHDQYFFAEPTRMVAGVVSAPNLDLGNRELLEAHLRAVWLAETGQKLPSSVKDLLDLEAPECPVAEEFRASLDTEAARSLALARGRRIVTDVQAQLPPEQAAAFNDEWLQHTIQTAYARFSQSFDRWRSLYQATRAQMADANQVVMNPVASEAERRDADRRGEEAKRQYNLLLSSETRNDQGDFSTYRYLASQGFMPGYNFPRLPLLAYLPARRRQVGNEKFLSRPRFLGLSEFGPQSLIYHEGSTYRVTKAILGVRAERSAESTGLLPTQTGVICGVCGHAHFGEDARLELCLNCATPLAPHPDGEGRPLQGLYRIEQVSTTKAEQITSDEEERQRLGYELLTTYRFARVQNRLAVRTAVVQEGGESLLELQFGPSTTLWRVNLGWKRRRNPQIVGFPINVTTGRWGEPERSPEEQDDEVEDTPREVTHQQIVPYVEDTKNALIVKLLRPLDPTTRVSFQYALKRGIETVYQLENNELACDPLPSRDDCRALLIYEAAEGGAGVLGRLVDTPAALQRVARTALDLCHWQAPSDDWSDPNALEDRDPDCEAGCYRCLLSYQNQPDHIVIDRRDAGLKQLLTRLTRATLQGQSSSPGEGESPYERLLRLCGSQLERDWIRFLRDGGYALPDHAQRPIPGLYVTPDFEYADAFALVFIDGPHHAQPRQQQLDAEQTQALEDAGYSVVRVGFEKETWPAVVNSHRWLFGAGESK